MATSNTSQPTQDKPNEKTYRDQLHQLTEQMNEHQAELVVSFVRTLFELPD